MNSRLQAVLILSDVLIDKKSLTEVFNARLKKEAQPGQNALAKELSYGVLRFYSRLSGIANQLLKKKMKQKDEPIFLLMLVGIYQLSALSMPDYAAVKETVEVAALLKRMWAKNLINAVLRNFLRSKEALLADAQKNAESWASHPRWMSASFQHDWPQDWPQIVEANNTKPPLTLRLNLKKQPRETYIEKLEALGITAQLHPWVETAVIVLSSVEVPTLPGFSTGDFSVQDASAQMAATLLDLKPNQYVLDACAAPGGKTTHLLECEPSLEVVALDQDASRLERVKENLQRLQFKATCLQADATQPAAWWEQRYFDRILLDAPCTATGVIRRHPDIKWLRQPVDVIKTVALQNQLLETLWPLLKPNGVLLYCTCSVFKAENSELVAEFIATHADCVEEKISGAWGIELAVGRQILPVFENDGFYYVRLRKVADK